MVLLADDDWELRAALSALVASASQPPQIMAKDVVIQRKKFGIENQRLIKLLPCVFERVKQIPLVDRVPGQETKDTPPAV